MTPAEKIANEVVRVVEITPGGRFFRVEVAGEAVMPWEEAATHVRNVSGEYRRACVLAIEKALAAPVPGLMSEEAVSKIREVLKQEEEAGRLRSVMKGTLAGWINLLLAERDALLRLLREFEDGQPAAYRAGYEDGAEAMAKKVVESQTVRDQLTPCAVCGGPGCEGCDGTGRMTP